MKIFWRRDGGKAAAFQLHNPPHSGGQLLTIHRYPQAIAADA